ncbi:hypothetical protein ONS95_014787 [Cadophora gregata]|uniref:uncharacterized protein n=1 Tax=Cadophora gregata TaxID=51156 RepID=UPI0026DD089A|nr:uncharacterized protein ONS95_014787 [Cadophora gregata]KAK0113081.1 hypothetical protein ONS95_014787 [Cadophora gregata]
MASTETTAKPEQPDSSRVDESHEIAQDSSPDQSTDPKMEQSLQTTSADLDQIRESLGNPTSVDDKQK